MSFESRYGTSTFELGLLLRAARAAITFPRTSSDLFDSALRGALAGALAGGSLAGSFAPSRKASCASAHILRPSAAAPSTDAGTLCTEVFVAISSGTHP